MKKLWIIILIIILIILANQKLKENDVVNDAKHLLIWDVGAFSWTKDVTQLKEIKTPEQWFYAEIKWGKYNQPVMVFDSQVNEMVKRGYSLTRILDLLTIKTMECNRYDGKCFNWNDVWPFQINKIHKLQYIKSHDLFYSGAKLFKYQLTFADSLLSFYMDNYCDLKWSKDNKTRFKCIAISYNGHPRYKVDYANLWWEKREMIKEYIISNYPGLSN